MKHIHKKGFAARFSLESVPAENLHFDVTVLLVETLDVEGKFAWPGPEECGCVTELRIPSPP